MKLPIHKLLKYWFQAFFNVLFNSQDRKYEKHL